MWPFAIGLVVAGRFVVNF